MDFVVVVSGWVIQVVHHLRHPPYRAAIYIHAPILYSSPGSCRCYFRKRRRGEPSWTCPLSEHSGYSGLSSWSPGCPVSSFFQKGATVWWGSPLLARPLTLVDSFGTEPICTTCGLRKKSLSAFQTAANICFHSYHTPTHIPRTVIITITADL